MSKIESALFISYVLTTCYFFINWLRFSLRHPASSPQDKFLSFVMFSISTILWPLVIPLSCIEMFKTRKLEFSTVVPVVVAVCVYGISWYLS